MFTAAELGTGPGARRCGSAMPIEQPNDPKPIIPGQDPPEPAVPPESPPGPTPQEFPPTPPPVEFPDRPTGIGGW